MNRPTDYDWSMMAFCQKISHAVRQSDNLRLPQDPKQALKDMDAKLRPARKDGAA